MAATKAYVKCREIDGVEASHQLAPESHGGSFGFGGRGPQQSRISINQSQYSMVQQLPLMENLSRVEVSPALRARRIGWDGLYTYRQDFE